MLIKVNNRMEFTANVESVTRVRTGVYKVVRRGMNYMVEGGKNLGGSRSDWFITGPGFIKYVPCKSVADAVRLLDTM